MNSPNYVKPNFPANAFKGTALYYSRYRIPYPDALIEDLISRVGIKDGDRLLDLASGPGRLAIPLSASFSEVVANDLEPEMIDEGMKEADKQGATNIRWVIGKSEELKEEPVSFKLITIGEAFHRLDQLVVSRQALRLLVPGGCLAVIGCYGITEGTEPWQRIVAETVQKWTEQASPIRKMEPKPGSGPKHNRLVLQDAGFVNIEAYSFTKEHTWTVESILGYLFSTSQCSKNALGAYSEDFALDLRNQLLNFDSKEQYRANMDCGYTIGRKPK
ncbi:MAG: class I SAM-dependent methyltransferase [Euryarchaeota archaeon]|nr:class I SAM-dependent methyltransferase [Euryarchaeota archaeon]